MGRKVLIIGGGGREHALAWKLTQSPGVEVFATPGNPGIARVATCSPLPGSLRADYLSLAQSIGVDLTVVEMGERMVPRMMTPGASALIKAWCEAKGIRVLTKARVVSIAPSGSALVATLDSGQKIEADLVISATGVAPNIAFLEASGVACDQGVLVDDRMQSSVAGIYAAGDVAQAPEFDTGKQSVYAIQPTAADQARTAALNMAGRDTASPGNLAMNVLDTLGLVASSFGRWQGVPDATPRAASLHRAAS